MINHFLLNHSHGSQVVCRSGSTLTTVFLLAVSFALLLHLLRDSLDLVFAFGLLLCDLSCCVIVVSGAQILRAVRDK